MPIRAFSKLSRIKAYISPPSVPGPSITALWAHLLTLRREGHTTMHIVTVTVHNKQSVDSKWSHSYLEAVTDGEVSLSSVCAFRADHLRLRCVCLLRDRLGGLRWSCAEVVARYSNMCPYSPGVYPPTTPTLS